MGILESHSESLTSPIFAEVLTTVGSIARGISKRSRSSWSHCFSCILNNKVRLALLESVTCNLPFVKFQINQLSMVPNRTSPFSAFSLTPLCVFRIQLSFVALKYGSSSKPVFSFMSVSKPFSLRAAQYFEVLRSCQTIALQTGCPVDLSQTTVVSR